MRRSTTIILGGAVAVALALGGLAGGVLAESRSAASTRPATSAVLAEQAITGVSGGVGAYEVSRLESDARARPRDGAVLTNLGLAYQVRWRETSDPAYLTRSEKVLRRALRVDRRNGNAMLGLGAVSVIRHDFGTGLVYGRRAARLLPGSARPYGVISDALVELGRYPEAFRAFETMVSLRPSLASYARVAYARELRGDVVGARAVMRLALDAAAGQPEPTAWARVELSKLQHGPGRTLRAERLLRQALALVPGYVPARMELVRIELAKGRLDRALAQARRAADASPTPHTYDLLAEVLDRAGRHEAARRQRAAGGPLDRDLVANGMRIGLEIAVHHADFRVAPAKTVDVARKARAEAPSIHGDDALGWALARAGRCVEALPHARRALRLGTPNPLMLFHRGYAQGCAGNRAAMLALYEQALAIDPEFSVRWAPVAEAALRNA